MEPFDISQAFLEECQRTNDPEELKRTFEKAIQRLGFRYFACSSHVDPLAPPPGAVMLLSYPKEWVQYFSQTSYHKIDPVFQHASRALLPFSWDDGSFRAGLTPLQLEILNQARKEGIAHGYTVPIHRPGALTASCSLIPDSTSIDNQSYLAACIMGAYLYDALSAQATAAARRNPAAQARLTGRERQCLELAAQGKSDWVVGRILQISERTVHNHIESAKRRLGVATRVQAIVHALFDRQISFGDVIVADSGESALAYDLQLVKKSTP